jgi:MFS family permease
MNADAEQPSDRLLSGVADETERSNRTRGLLVPIAGIYVTVLLSFLTVGLVLPLAPVTLVDRLGQSESWLGYSLIGLAIGALLGRFLGGAFVDARGSRLGFLVGLSISFVGGLSYAFAINTWLFLFGRLILGLGESIVYIAAATAIMNLVPENRRSRFFGLLGSAVWGGISIGPAIGERLSKAESAGRITLGCVAIGMLIVLSVLGTLETPRRPFSFRMPTAAILPGTVVGMYNLGYAAVTGFVIVHLRDNGIPSAWALTTYGLSVLFGRIALGGIPDRLGPLPSITTGIAFMMIALGVVTIAPNRIAVLGALVLFGIGYSMPFPAVASHTVDRVPASERAAGLAVLGGMYDVFVGIAGLLFGLIVDSRLGTDWVFITAIGFGAGALVLAHRVIRPVTKE